MLTETLKNQVRRKLNITWEDDETNARIQEIADSAEVYLRHKLGITDPDFGFEQAGAENTLFLAYCLYEWNHVANEFEDNYAKMIADVRAQYAVADYLNSEVEDEA